MVLKNSLINSNTGTKQKLNAIKNSYDVDRILRLKEFAPNRHIKYSNKLELRLYNSTSSLKSFWIMLTNPLLKVLNIVGVQFVQVFIDLFVIPYYRIKIKINSR